MTDSSLFIQFLILLGSATIVATIFHSFRLPTIVGLTLTGVLIGPYGLRLVNSIPGAHLLTEVGSLLLMFTLGLEFSFRRLKEMGRSFLVLGGVQVSGSVIVATGVAILLMGLSLPKAFLIGCLISLSSTALVMKLLQDARETGTLHGNCSVGILLFQDIAFIPMILAVPLLAPTETTVWSPSLASIGTWILKLTVSLAALWGATRVIVPFLLMKVIESRSRELFFFCILFLCFGMAYAMSAIGLSLGLGAFMAGVTISESPYGRQVTADIVPLRDNFLGLFFLSVGMLLDLQFLGQHVGLIFILGTLLFAIKGAVIFGSVRLARYPVGVALVTALMLCQIGEFSFILAGAGLKLQILSTLEYQLFLCISVISIMVTPFLHRLLMQWQFSPQFAELIARGRKNEKIREALAAASKPNPQEASPLGHTIIIGFGIAGRNLAGALKGLNIPYRAVDMNFDEVQKQQKLGEAIIWGDASKAEVLEQVQLHSAKQVVLAITGSVGTRAILAAIRRMRPDIAVIVRAQYLREVNDLSDVGQCDIVVGEFETAIEILARALRNYGVSSRQIHEFMSESHRQLEQHHINLSDSLRRTIEIPGWETLAAIRPFQLKQGASSVGRAIVDIRLRELTGVSIVSVFREGLGTTIPRGEFVLEAGDLLHLIGSREDLDRAELVLGGRETSVASAV